MSFFKNPPESKRYFLAWSILTLFFLIEYLIRVSPNVAEAEMAKQWSLHNFDFGLLAAVFYYSYVIMQIPVGILLDRFGLKFCSVTAMICCAIATWCWASSQIFSAALFFRMLIGISAAFAFVSGLRLARAHLPLPRFGLMVGLTQASGMLGATIGDAPLSWMFHHFGWQIVLKGLAILVLLMALILFRLLKDEVAPKQLHAEHHQHRHVWLSLDTWLNVLFIGCLYAPTVAFGEIWGTSFIQHTWSLTTTQASLINSCIFIGLLIACPIYGYLDQRGHSLTKLMGWSASMCWLLFGLLMWVMPMWLHPNVLVLAGMTFIYGIFNAGIVSSYTLAGRLHNSEQSGLALGMTNMGSVMIGSIMLLVIGRILDNYHVSMTDISFNHQSIAFKAAMAPIMIVQIVGLMVVWKLTTRLRSSNRNGYAYGTKSE